MINWIKKRMKKSKWEKLNKKGAWLRLNGDLFQAVRVLKKARIIALEVFGREHPDYITTLCNLAKLYHDIGEYAKANLISLGS